MRIIYTNCLLRIQILDLLSHPQAWIHLQFLPQIWIPFFTSSVSHVRSTPPCFESVRWPCGLWPLRTCHPSCHFKLMPFTPPFHMPAITTHHVRASRDRAASSSLLCSVLLPLLFQHHMGLSEAPLIITSLYQIYDSVDSFTLRFLSSRKEQVSKLRTVNKIGWTYCTISSSWHWRLEWWRDMLFNVLD